MGGFRTNLDHHNQLWGVRLLILLRYNGNHHHRCKWTMIINIITQQLTKQSLTIANHMANPPRTSLSAKSAINIRLINKISNSCHIFKRELLYKQLWVAYQINKSMDYSLIIGSILINCQASQCLIIMETPNKIRHLINTFFNSISSPQPNNHPALPTPCRVTWLKMATQCTSQMDTQTITSP